MKVLYAISKQQEAQCKGKCNKNMITTLKRESMIFLRVECKMEMGQVEMRLKRLNSGFRHLRMKIKF